MAPLFGMKAAAVDLGTNTFELLIADLRLNGSWMTLHSGEVAVFLGKGGIEKNTIAQEAEQRAIECLKDFAEMIKDHGCEKVKCTATSALRNATNSVEVIEHIRSETGLTIEVISGDQEAALIAKGTGLAMQDLEEPFLVMDIGGGSTEFVLMEGNEVHFKQSIEIGATRLIERCGISDPLDQEQISCMKQNINDGFAPILEVMEQIPTQSLVGGSGTFDTFKSMMDLNSEHSCVQYNSQELSTLLDQIIHSDRAARGRMDGLVEFRIDTIVPSALMVKHFLSNGIEKIYWSGYALKEGVMQEIAENSAPA